MSAKLLARRTVKLHPQEISETAIIRSKLVDVYVARWYRCLSRCVRKAFLLGEQDRNPGNGSRTASRNSRKSAGYRLDKTRGAFLRRAVPERGGRR
jgi:hypothetical protein